MCAAHMCRGVLIRSYHSHPWFTSKHLPAVQLMSPHVCGHGAKRVVNNMLAHEGEQPVLASEGAATLDMCTLPLICFFSMLGLQGSKLWTRRQGPRQPVTHVDLEAEVLVDALEQRGLVHARSEDGSNSSSRSVAQPPPHLSLSGESSDS